MDKIILDADERRIVDIFNPHKVEYQIPDSLPVDFIIKNRLCLSFYRKVGPKIESKFSSDELNRIWRKARYMDYSINELHIISKTFEENEIDHVFLFKAIESYCDSTDVDTVVEDTMMEKASEILKTLGYFIPLSPCEKHQFVKSKDGNVVQIDLRTERVNTITHYIFEEKARILNNKRKVNGLYVPSIEDDLLICIERAIDKGEIPIGTLLHIAHLLEHCHNIDYIKNIVKNGWYTPLLHTIYVTHVVYNNLFGKAIESPLIPVAERIHEKSRILRFLVKKETKKIKLPFDSKIFLYFWGACRLLISVRHLNVSAIAKRMSSHFPPIVDRIKLISCARKKSLLVSFSGIDGTGKSTNSEKLVRRFKDMRIPSQYALGLWTPKISYPLMGLLYLLKGWRRKDYHKSKILQKTWNYIVILDYIYLYLNRVWIHRLVGKTVFLDKYTYDLMAMLMHDGLYNEKASRLLLKLIPKPDLVFIFDIPEKVSDERKDDTQEGLNKLRVDQDILEYLRIKRRSYIKIAKSLNIPLIDSTRDFNTLHEETFNKIVDKYKNKE